MTRREIVLAALAPSNGEKHSPVQVQKLLFLLDKEACELVDGPHFDFKPYNYGPFDKHVYEVLESLGAEGLVTIFTEEKFCKYALTPKGQVLAEKVLGNLSEDANKYINKASEFVRRLGFTKLVSAIYKAYPEMQENSIVASS